MELWIRSQNKLILQKVNAFLITQSDKDKWTIIDNQNLTIYGTYKSKERALEVLNEIQNRLMPYSEIIQDTEGITISYKNVSTIIYEMPKE